jgi:glycosyltransferase involved in cell wall biosynthesis
MSPSEEPATWPDVTVVVPARDCADTIDQQLDALGAQDHPGPWDVVVALQPSVDDSAGVLARRQDPWLRVVDATGTVGAGGARNAGVAATSAEVLAFCDADDVVTPTWLRRLLSHPEADAVVGARLPFTGTFDEGTIDHRKRYGPDTNSGFLPNLFGGNFAIRRTVFEALGGFDVTFESAEDIDLGFRLQERDFVVETELEAVIYYRLRTSGTQRFAQQFRWGLGRVRLYRHHAAFGMPRSDDREALREWAWLVAGAVRCRDPAFRRRWTQRLAVRSGRLVGSIRQRRRYL